jgi:hypothetical protein
MPSVMKINEPILTQRETSVRLTSGGVGVAGVLNANITVKIARPGGTYSTDGGCSVTEVTGGADANGGVYRLRLSAAAVQLDGEVEYELTDATASGVFDPVHGFVTVEPLRDSTYYGTLSAATANTTTLNGTGVSAVDSYYAGGGRDCVVICVSGTGVGQANFATAYNGTTKVLTYQYNWPTTLDNTSIIKIYPFTGQLDAATVTSIQTAILSAVAAIPTNPLLTSDGRLNHLDADISSRLAPSVGGRTLDVNAGHQAGIDWGNVGNQASAVTLSSTTINQITSLAGGALTAIANAILGATFESTLTVAHGLQAIFSSVASKVSGLSTNSPKFRDFADTKNRISGTTTSDGRTTVTFSFD